MDTFTQGGRQARGRVPAWVLTAGREGARITRTPCYSEGNWRLLRTEAEWTDLTKAP